MDHLYSSGLNGWDWLVVAAYGASVLLIGWYVSRKKEDTDSYFTGGRHMPPFLIGISLFASLLSTVSYLAYPGEIIQHGPIYLFGVLSIPIAYYIVGYGLIPKYMQFRVTSAYELLEARLGLGVRLMGAVLFILLRLIWMALLVYLASKAMIVMTGLPEQWLPVFSIGTGAVAILYTSIGGFRAVVITDCMQFFLLLLGAILVIGKITLEFGGFQWFPTTWNPNWDTQPLFSFDPTVRATLIGAIIMHLMFRVSTAGSDQTVVQRFMATSDAKAARRSYLVQSLAGLVVLIFLGLLGFALLAYFQANPAVTELYSLESDADHLFPYFIAHHLPTGFSGLVVAALFAAGMSSIDSGVNSISAVVNRDFLTRLNLLGGRGESVRFNQFLALGIGMITVLLSILAQYVPGNYLEVTQKTTNLLFPSLFGLFLYAIFIPRATSATALIGTLNGIIAAIVVAFWDLLTGNTALSFQWIGIVSLCSNLFAGLFFIWMRGAFPKIRIAHWIAVFLVGIVSFWSLILLVFNHN